MRYRKGMMVEVLKHSNETHSSSWRTAHVISGNGRTYDVRYDHCPSIDGAGELVERVPREAMRPCPPEATWAKDCVPGDFVEVLDDGSWKGAMVCRVLDDEDSCYLVRLFGSSNTLLRARSSHLRVRQTWQNDRWLAIHEDLIKPCSENPNVNDSSRKRRFDSSRPAAERSTAEAPKKKIKVIKKVLSILYNAADHEQHQMVQLLGKVNRPLSVNKDMVSLFDYQKPVLRNPQPVRVKSISPSVGSCTAHSSDDYSLKHCSADFPRSSDAESRCPSRRRGVSLLNQGEEVVFGAESCRPELSEYRRRLKALHASCPAAISWDQEAVLADLRLELNISNDEHVQEVKSLLRAARKQLGQI